MEKRILFVSESQESFLITALEKTLSNAGFEIVFSKPHPREIDDIPVLPNLFIVYLDADDTRYNTTLTYFKEKLSGSKEPRYLYLIGNPIEIASALKIIPHRLVAGIFERPVNTTDLITQLNLIVSGYSYEESRDSVERGIVRDVDSNKRSLLLVDDDSTLLRSMQNWLSKKYNVFITNSGMNTISFLRERAVDLILLDYEMPVLSGQEVFQILKTEPNTANIPVIFLTSKDDKEIVMKVLALKPANYLLKPVPPTILTQTVDEFFKKQEEEAELRRRRAAMPHPEEDLEELEPDDFTL